MPDGSLADPGVRYSRTPVRRSHGEGGGLLSQDAQITDQRYEGWLKLRHWGEPVGFFYDPRVLDVERLPHLLEALPSVAFHLAALVEYTEDRIPGGVEELAQHSGVPDDAVVVEVTIQFAAQGSRQLSERGAFLPAQPCFQGLDRRLVRHLFLSEIPLGDSPK